MKKLCDTADLPAGVAREFTLPDSDTRYIVVYINDTFYIYLNSCPHLGLPLNWEPDRFMDDELDVLRCASHGALFLPDTGYCIQGPCAGQSLKKITFTHKDDALYV